MLPPRSKYAQDSLFPTVMGALAYYAGRRLKKGLGLVSYSRYLSHHKTLDGNQPFNRYQRREARYTQSLHSRQHSQTFERKDSPSRTYGRTVAHSLRAAMTRRRITILLLACNTRALRITRRQAGAAAALGLAGPARAVEEVRPPRPLAYRILKGDPPLMQPYEQRAAPKLLKSLADGADAVLLGVKRNDPRTTR